jgi:hypothetical protein
MKAILSAILLAAATGAAGMAQSWEMGVSAGGSLTVNRPLKTSAGSVDAGAKPGAAFEAYVGQSYNRHFAGEVRYGFQQSTYRLSGQGQTATFSGQGHVFYYDVSWRTQRANSKWQFFVAAGGGGKLFRGTGDPVAAQPLVGYAALTQTKQFTPLFSGGMGLRYAWKAHTVVRFEVRDYMTPFPKDVITPMGGATVSGPVHNIVPQVGLGYQF